MTPGDLGDAQALLGAFLGSDPHIRDSSAAYGDGGGEALAAALRLFLAHPETGFVWLGYQAGSPIAACVVCFAISTSVGARVAKLDDVCVALGQEGRGAGTALLQALAQELKGLHIRRIDTSCHLGNAGARRFYERLGFRCLNEERLALLL